jgi:hypothetical protein
MTRKFIAIAATALALAGSAHAMTQADAVFASSLRGFVSDVDLSSLTQAQIDALKLVIHSGNSASEIRSSVRSIING